MRVELSDAFDRCQLFDLLLQNRTGLVDRREDGRDVIDDCCTVSGVVDLQVADDLDQHFELAGALCDVFFKLFRVCDFCQFINA